MSAPLDECPNCGHSIRPPGAGYTIGSGHGKQDDASQHRRDCPECQSVLRLVEGAWKVSPNEPAEN